MNKVDQPFDYTQKIQQLCRVKNAVIMAHYYQREEIQDIAHYIGDSLALAQYAAQTDAAIIVLCGVHFMAETAKIISPDKKVLIPDPQAGCSLADSCPADEFKKFVEAHPDHTVISYVNTSAAVKAYTDVVVTSTNAKKIVDSFPKEAKIIFGPDRNLGNYINSVTGRNMLLWDGSCHVHEQFSLEKLLKIRSERPEAIILAHPECKSYLLKIADYIGSTAALLDYVKSSDADTFIVATESGIIHQMRLSAVDKEFIPAPPEDSTCACNECSYMKLNTLEKLYNCLLHETGEIDVDPEIAKKAKVSIDRMLKLSK